MTPQERDFLKLLDRARASNIKYSQRIREAREALQTTCTHPVEAQEPMFWWHDNGYGKQSRCEGKACKICHAKKYYDERWWLTVQDRL